MAGTESERVEGEHINMRRAFYWRGHQKEKESPGLVLQNFFKPKHACRLSLSSINWPKFESPPTRKMLCISFPATYTTSERTERHITLQYSTHTQGATILQALSIWRRRVFYRHPPVLLRATVAPRDNTSFVYYYQLLVACQIQ